MAKQQRSEETRSRILTAAVDCFSREGYDATGVAEICSAAGVSKGAFYHHFPSKQALFVELLDSWLARMDGQFAAIRKQAASVPEALRSMAREARQIVAESTGHFPIFLEFWNQASRDPVILARVVEPYRRYEQYFAGLVEMGIREGSLREMDPHTAARVLIGLAVGLLVQAQANPDSADWAVLFEHGVKMLLIGWQREAVEPGRW